MKAMIFAAGLGTRLKPLTDSTPKALVKINGKTLLERCIINLKKSGINEIVVNVHHFADQVIQFIEKMNMKGVSISDEKEELLDTGGGLLKASDKLNGPDAILLINVDILTNLDFKELIDFHMESKALATLVVRKRASSRYLLFNTEKMLCGWKNTKTSEIKASRPNDIEGANKFAFSGIQVISPKFLELIEEKGKFSIIDLYLRLAKNYPIKAYLDVNSAWMDLGKYDEFEEAEKIVKQFDQADTIN